VSNCPMSTCHSSDCPLSKCRWSNRQSFTICRKHPFDTELQKCKGYVRGIMSDERDEMYHRLSKKCKNVRIKFVIS
jgi:hypothetical protein